MTRKERYHWRKANRKCVDCAAGLQDADHVRCVECAERRQNTLDKYSTTHAKERSERSAAWQKRNRERANEINRIGREDRRERGLCIACIEQKLPDSIYCEKHRETHRAAARNYARRRREAARAERKAA